MATQPREFDELLLSAIDEALNYLGESVRQSIFFHIQNTFDISHEDIPVHLENFQLSLEKIFGAGARFIEILIMKNLYAKIGLPIIMENGQELVFTEYVTVARKKYSKGKR